MNIAYNTRLQNVCECTSGRVSKRELLSSESMNICWNEMSFNRKEKIHVYEGGRFIELHFQFNGFSKTLYEDKNFIMPPNTQSIFYVDNFEGEHEQYKDNMNPFSFFEIKLGHDAVKNLFPEELWHELSFIKKLFDGSTSSIDSIKPVTPQMNSVICDMCNCPFTGTMSKAYLEAKVIELFLLQAESHKPLKNVTLKKQDVDKLIATKDFIDENYLEKLRIIDLAKIAGTNQQMLKTGFRELFGTTVFGYYNDLRMERAKHLLVSEEKRVTEVADEMGYKNPQHFTVAFKKKFGVLPKDLKGN